MLLVLVLSNSCSREEIVEEAPFSYQNRIIKVTHHYDYYGEKFSVTYTYDQEEHKLLDRQGDLEMAQKVFGNPDQAPQGILYDITGANETGVAHAMLFRTKEEALAQVDPSSHGASRACDYMETSGSATFRFYEHANYVSELTTLTKTNKRSLGWNYVMNQNNDKMSSFKVSFPNNQAGNGWMQMNIDWCYQGTQLLFHVHQGYLECPNLETYWLCAAFYWGNYTVYYNDQISSLYGIIDPI